MIFNGTQLEVLPDCNIAIIRGDSGPCSWIYQTKRLDYDQGMLSRIVPYILSYKLSLDIGAFIGSHSFEYLKHSLGVISFEPNPSAFWCLSHNCPRAVKINMALGDKFTERYWTRIYPNCGASYLSDMPSPDCLVVQVRPLDSFKFGLIGFLKIDAEGEEVAILRGGRETIRKNKPAMCIEVNDAALNRTGTSRHELLSLLKEYGYYTEPIYPGSDTGDQWDVLAIHLDDLR
jgi:FkbM family methyltransferase